MLWKFMINGLSHKIHPLLCSNTAPENGMHKSYASRFGSAAAGFCFQIATAANTKALRRVSEEPPLFFFKTRPLQTWKWTPWGPTKGVGPKKT